MEPPFSIFPAAQCLQEIKPSNDLISMSHSTFTLFCRFSSSVPRWLRGDTRLSKKARLILPHHCRGSNCRRAFGHHGSWSCDRYADLFLCVPQGRVQIENGALSITALNLSDSGMYQCVAENKHGTIYYSAQLMVLGKIVSLLLPLRAWMSVFSDKKDARPFLQKSASKHSWCKHDACQHKKKKNIYQMECLVLLLVVWCIDLDTTNSASWHCSCFLV